MPPECRIVTREEGSKHLLPGQIAFTVMLLMNKPYRPKKVELRITQIGSKLLNVKKQELDQKRQQMQESYDNGDGTQLQSYMDANRMWMPMMLFSGIIDMMFFTSMMSFMGLRINPMESAIIGSDSGHHDTGASTHSVHDQSATSGGDSNSDTSFFIIDYQFYLCNYV